MNVVFTPEKINQYIDRIRQQKILVVGDLMLDQFIWGRVDRISPEAPVPVVQVTRESAYPGGAANVARNLSDFGIATVVSGKIGKDEQGRQLLRLFKESQISTRGILIAAGFSTIQKTRIIARQQQVVRVDKETIRPLEPHDIEKILKDIEKITPDVDAIIIEDYGKGFITQDLVDGILGLAKTHHKIVAADPNPQNPLSWAGATLVKPNRHEAFLAARRPFSEDNEALIELGHELLRNWGIRYLLITLGEEGMILFQHGEEPYHSPTKAREVYDVSGAGDTAVAFFTAAIAAGLPGPEATEIANHAAGVVVGKLGTATLNPKELAESLQNHE